MRYGINAKGRRVDIFDAIEINKKNEYFCPCCAAPLVIKNGDINIPHFAHKSKIICDTFSHDMSEWHRGWQNNFPSKNREVIIKLNITENQFQLAKEYYNFGIYEKPENPNNKIIITHIADVCIGKYVIEFQHSPISAKEFNERNWFYASAGFKVIWIFDMINEFRWQTIQFYDEWDSDYDNGGKYKWLNPKRMFKNFTPQRLKKHVALFFQFMDDDEDEDESIYMKRVVWAIEDDEGYCSFRRFLTSYKITEKNEFIDAIYHNKI